MVSASHGQLDAAIPPPGCGTCRSRPASGQAPAAGGCRHARPGNQPSSELVGWWAAAIVSGVGRPRPAPNLDDDGQHAVHQAGDARCWLVGSTASTKRWPGLGGACRHQGMPLSRSSRRLVDVVAATSGWPRRCCPARSGIDRTTMTGARITKLGGGVAIRQEHDQLRRVDLLHQDQANRLQRHPVEAHRHRLPHDRHPARRRGMFVSASTGGWL